MLSTRPSSCRNSSSSSSSSSSNRLIYLLDRLDSLRCATTVGHAEDAMQEFTHGLLDLKLFKKSGGSSLNQALKPRTTATSSKVTVFTKKGDETLLHDLHVHGNAIDTLLDAIRRCMIIVESVRPEFFSSACIALIHFALESKERSRYIYNFYRGGYYGDRRGDRGSTSSFDVIFDLMQAYRSVDYIQIVGMTLVRVIGKNMGNSRLFFRSELLPRVLHQIVLAMKYHRESSQVYTVACSALGHLLIFGPRPDESYRRQFAVSNRRHRRGRRGHGYGDNDDNNNNNNDSHTQEVLVYNRALEAITYGLVFHLDDTTAIDTGTSLLRNIVGPSVAKEMIHTAERKFCEATSTNHHSTAAAA